MVIEIDGCSAYQDADLVTTQGGIDPHKIESVIAQHEQVKEAVVLATGDQLDKRVVAYILPAGQPAGLVRRLRSHLNSSLPPHMMPSAFVLLDPTSLPNGTIDRQALPLIDPSCAQLSTIYREPQTETEIQVARLLSQVLEVTSIGRDDDFFELGGNSILAVKFTASVMETFGVRILPRSFYEGPTVMELAQVIESLLQDQRLEGGA
jgi:acyl carrier protein